MKIEIGDYVEFIRPDFLYPLNGNRSFLVDKETKAKVIDQYKHYSARLFPIIECVYWDSDRHEEIYISGYVDDYSIRLINKGVIKDVSGFETLFNTNLT